MTRLVILEFDENDAAEKLVDYMSGRMEAGALNKASIVMAYANVVGVYGMPTKFCTCRNPQKFGKTKRFGWWVHKGCSKPTDNWKEGYHNIIATAHNLLEEILRRDHDEDAATPNSG